MKEWYKTTKTATKCVYRDRNTTSIYGNETEKIKRFFITFFRLYKIRGMLSYLPEKNMNNILA